MLDRIEGQRFQELYVLAVNPLLALNMNELMAPLNVAQKVRTYLIT